MASRPLQTYYFLGLLGVALVLVLFMLGPYIQGILAAVALAVVFEPFYLRILPRVGGRPSIAALICVLVVLILILTPLLLFGIQIAGEASGLYTYLIASGDGYSNTFEALLGGEIQSFFPELFNYFHFDITDINKGIRQGVGSILNNIGSLFSGTVRIIVNFFIALISFYYLLKDGERFREALINFSPLPDEYDQQIFAKLKTAINSVVRGTLVIAMIQGLLAGIGFALFGVPNPALWGAVTATAALVPAVGTSIVLVPAIFYLFLIGETTYGFALLLWGATAVGLIDQILGPKLIERGMNVHPLFIIISVLGGLSVFGPMGFLIGPLVLSFLFALLEIYKSFILEQPAPKST